MTIDYLISSYKRTSQELQLAILKEDDTDISKLDVKISAIHQDILSLEISEREGKNTQAKYLLDQLSPMNQRSEFQQQMVNKLLTMLTG